MADGVITDADRLRSEVDRLRADNERLRALLAEIHAKPYRAEEVTTRYFAAPEGATDGDASGDNV